MPPRRGGPTIRVAADGLRRAGDFGVHRGALGMVVEDADAQPTRVRAELVDVGTSGGGAITVSPMPGPRVASSNAARVTNGAADAVLDRQPAFVADRAERDAPLARLEPDQSATRRRDADRSAAVAGVGERHHPRRDGGGRTTARSTGRAFR